MSDQQKKPNPLSQWYRQPKIWIQFPSKGEFYPPGALDKSENDQYPVYAMTAKDEMLFKTPDALLTGQSTVEVIKSCIPAILDPWKMPSLDVDVALIAIRVATYGDNMEVSSNCPSCQAENNYEVNLSNWLGNIGTFDYDPVIDVNPLTVHIRPYTYQELTKTSLKTMEQQRIFQIINDDTISDESKLEKFGVSFVKLTELTVDVIASCISKIETPDGETSDPEQIKEFINNTSKDIFDKISERINGIKKEIEFKPLDAKCTSCGEEFSMPITIDQSNFFAVRS
jgi:predicted Zn-ribbon and HTH transcriptional regulator